MVLFCGECFHFGYTKYYNEYYDYDGFDEKVDDYSALSNNSQLKLLLFTPADHFQQRTALSESKLWLQSP